MKKLFVYFAVALVAAGSISYSTYAQSNKRSVDASISCDAMRRKTLARKVYYRGRFNFETGELTLMNNGEVIATVKGQVVEREMKSRYTAVSLRDTGSGRKMVGLMLAGDKRTLVLNDLSNTTRRAEEKFLLPGNGQPPHGKQMIRVWSFFQITLKSNQLSFRGVVRRGRVVASDEPDPPARRALHCAMPF